MARRRNHDQLRARDKAGDARRDAEVDREIERAARTIRYHRSPTTERAVEELAAVRSLADLLACGHASRTPIP